jgi:hypothetical protein
MKTSWFFIFIPRTCGENHLFFFTIRFQIKSKILFQETKLKNLSFIHFYNKNQYFTVVKSRLHFFFKATKFRRNDQDEFLFIFCCQNRHVNNLVIRAAIFSTAKKIIQNSQLAYKIYKKVYFYVLQLVKTFKLFVFRV